MVRGQDSSSILRVLLKTTHAQLSASRSLDLATITRGDQPRRIPGGSAYYMDNRRLASQDWELSDTTRPLSCGKHSLWN